MNSNQLLNVRNRYDRWAGVYDLNPLLQLVYPARRWSIEALDLSPGDTVVDMGTGTGVNLSLLRDAVGRSGTVIGIDASPKMVKQAQVRVDENGWDNVNLLQGDIRKPPIEETIDGICSTFVAVMYDDPNTLLEPWANLADGGTIATLYTGPSQRWYGPVVNGLLRTYLRIIERREQTGEDSQPLDRIAQRSDRIRTAMSDLARSTVHEAFVLGVLKLDVGRF